MGAGSARVAAGFAAASRAGLAWLRRVGGLRWIELNRRSLNTERWWLQLLGGCEAMKVRLLLWLTWFFLYGWV